MIYIVEQLDHSKSKQMSLNGYLIYHLTGGKCRVEEDITFHLPLTASVLPEPSFTIIFNYIPLGFKYILLFMYS